MVDHLSREGRSRNMAAIRSKNTGPELALRQALRTAGAVGYRLHRTDLPGKPDVAFTRWRVAVFVDGVFWHGHADHWDPDAANDYWRAKIRRTQQRDRAADEALTELGWVVVRIWDIEVTGALRESVSRVISALATQGWHRPEA